MDVGYEYPLRSESQARLLVQGTYPTKAAQEAALKPLGLRNVEVRSISTTLEYQSNSMADRTRCGKSRALMSMRRSHLIVYMHTTLDYSQSICSPCGKTKSRSPLVPLQLRWISSKYCSLPRLCSCTLRRVEQSRKYASLARFPSLRIHNHYVLQRWEQIRGYLEGM